MLRRMALFAVALAASGVLQAAVPPAPPPPKNYNVVVSYRIVAGRNQRIAQFNTMMKGLAALGFQRDPNEEPPEDEAADSNATRLRGTVPASSARRLLLERHVRTLLLWPADEKLPEDAQQPVRVNIELVTGLPPDRQHLLHAQTAEMLASLKFKEAVGYDHCGYTRLVGSLPVEQIDAVLNDLRNQQSDQKLPAPFATLRAIRVVEAFPSMPLPASRPTPPVVPQGQETLASDIREVLADPARADKPLRFEILLANAPAANDRTWRRNLRQVAPDIALEGILGTLVTVTARPSQAPALAQIPEVVGIRLPRIAQIAPVPLNVDDTAALQASGLDRLHARGLRGKGSRIAVIAADFRGWEAMRGRELPKETKLIDLTRERNITLEPDPVSTGHGPGQGTLFAKAVANAAPEASLVLIRIDPAAPYMVQTVARAVSDEPANTLALDQRDRELDAWHIAIDLHRRELLEERREAFADLRDEEEAIKRREEYEKRQAALDQEDNDYQQRLHRYLDYKLDLLQLKNVCIVASALIWDAGHPAGGSSALSRYLDDRSFARALWIQAAEAGRGQIWWDLFRDVDDNGVMEFNAEGARLPDGSWSPELNFIAWQTDEAKPVLDLPAGARVRATVQWREAHNPELLRIGQDAFREPLTAIRLLVLRQLDPAGAKRPADDLEVVAQSSGLPRRLEQTSSSATYEVSVEWRVPETGRYAIRVEGRLPESDRPASMPGLPSQRRMGEVRPRIIVESLEGGGWPVWHDFRGYAASLGMPADARSVTAVDAGGPPIYPRTDLTLKPDLVAPVASENAGLATATAAGMAASTRSAGVPFIGWQKMLGLRPGAALQLPEDWQLPRSAK